MRQYKNENVQIFAERLLALAEIAYRGTDGNLALIERQLIGFFVSGLYENYLKMKVMRDNPDTLQNAVRSAMNEQNLRARFNLRFQNNQHSSSYNLLPGQEPMEIDHFKVKNCAYCKKPGHHISDCRKKPKHVLNVNSDIRYSNLPSNYQRRPDRSYDHRQINNRDSNPPINYQRRPDRSYDRSQISKRVNYNNSGQNFYPKGNWHNNRQGHYRNQNTQRSNWKVNMICWGCGQLGHVIRECHSQERNYQRKN
jgi:hypothetical protein